MMLGIQDKAYQREKRGMSMPTNVRAPPYGMPKGSSGSERCCLGYCLAEVHCISGLNERGIGQHEDFGQALGRVS